MEKAKTGTGLPTDFPRQKATSKIVFKTEITCIGGLQKEPNDST
jgi:hypothetical protein